MKVTYTGIQKELPPKLQQKLDAKFAKLAKLLERRGEKEVHVMVRSERHLHHVEITLNFYDHPLAAVASDADLFTSLTTAVDRLHKQGLKQRSKWRDGKRKKDNGAAAAAEPAEREETAPVRTQRVFRVNNHERRKPMTLEEAMLEMEQDRDYMVYRDADKDRVRVLVRRPDGHFDLIEA